MANEVMESKAQLSVLDRQKFLDQQDEHGYTALSSAAALSDPALSATLVELVISYGACVSLTDKDGYTALHWAAAINNAASVQLLVANKAYINQQGNDGETPLHRACRFGSAAAVKKLLELKADRHIRNADFESPYDVMGIYASRLTPSTRGLARSQMYASDPSLR